MVRTENNVASRGQFAILRSILALLNRFESALTARDLLASLKEHSPSCFAITVRQSRSIEGSMRRFPVFFFAAALLAFLFAPLSSTNVLAQSNEFARPLARITEAVDNTKLAPLHNQVPPMIARAVDQGPVEDTLPLDRMTLILKRSDAQQQALARLLADQQNPSAPSFHRWLTPQEFGARFGVADADIQQVTGWLESQGFKVEHVANGRGFIEFSGNAQQVASAFHTSMHQYSLSGEAHIANATTLAIPAALAPVVDAVRSLNDFRSRPLHTNVAGQVTGTMGDAGSRPAITFDTKNQQHGLAPADYAAIYNIQTVYSQGVTGSGKTIAVVGRSNINPATLANFRKIFISSSLGTGSNSTVLNGPDPGVLASVSVPCTTQADCGERDEALLDNEWSSAIAPGAAVEFVVSKSTNTADGVDLSEMFVIDNNLADVMTESFGACEGRATQADADAVSSLASQAAAQGITYLVSSGDSGASGCADPATASATGANAAPSVNFLASSPFTIAVGGTEFNEGCTIAADGFTLNCANYAQYWNASSAAGNSPTPFLSALGYIPENAWNEACPTATTGSVTGCLAANANLFAAGGGASQFIPKPSFQKLAIPGIPSADHRYLPDVSLTAAGHDFYVVCIRDTDCVPDPTTNQFQLGGIAGTSASTPAFAGIMALVVQKVGARQGDAHRSIYTLAASQNYAVCNGSNQSGVPAANCIFNDVTVGNNAVPGELGYGTAAASFQAGAGYDQATGLGSVNVANLVNQWTSANGNTASSVVLTVTPTTSIQRSSVILTAAVTGKGGTPTGFVAFVNSNGLTVGNGTVSAAGVATITITTLPTGTYTVTAKYGGDAAFAAQDSNAVSVTVTPAPSINTTTVVTSDSKTLSGTGVSKITLTAAVTGASGSIAPTGTVTFLDGTTSIATVAVSSVGGGTATATFSTNILPAATPTTIHTVASTLGWIGGGGVATLACFALMLPTRRRRWPMAVLLFLIGSTMFAVSGCGSGNSKVTNVSNPGVHQVTAQYSGDANYNASTSAALTITVQ